MQKECAIPVQKLPTSLKLYSRVSNTKIILKTPLTKIDKAISDLERKHFTFEGIYW